MSTNTNTPLFSMRIFSLEWTMERPVPGLDVTWSKFTSSPCRQVPVLHVFGTTPRGQKTCAHVHNAFPYLFVSVPTSVSWSSALVNNPQASNVYLRQLQVSIDRGMALSKQQSAPQQPGATSAPRAPVSESVIYSALLVRGKQFYGFTPHEQLFIKLFLYNPMELNRLVLLLRSGAIMQTQFSVYEAHIPYHLQFLADNNLFGMDWMHCSAAKFRTLPEVRHVQWNKSELSYQVPLIDQGPTSGNTARGLSMRVWTSEHVTEGEHAISPAGRLARSELEIDVDVDEIQNRSQARDQSTAHTDSESRVSSEQKIIQSLTYIWEEERRRGVKQEEVSPGLDQGTDSHPASRGVAVDMAASNSAHSSTSPAGFHHVIRDQIRALIESERTWLRDHDEHNLFATDSQPHLGTPAASTRAHGGEGTVEQGVTIEALIDEQLVLSQSSDKEVNDILNWMLDDELDEEGEEGPRLREEEELEDEERDKEHVIEGDTCQVEAGDIIASQQILHRSDELEGSRDRHEEFNHVTEREVAMNLEAQIHASTDSAQSRDRASTSPEVADTTNHVTAVPVQPITSEVSMSNAHQEHEDMEISLPARDTTEVAVPPVPGAELKSRQVQFNSTVTVYNYPRAQSRALVVLDTPPPSPTKTEAPFAVPYSKECEVSEPPRKKLKIDHSAPELSMPRDKSMASQSLEQAISQSDVKLKISSLQIWSPLSSIKPRASQVSNTAPKEELPRATTHVNEPSLPRAKSQEVPADSVNASIEGLSPELISGHVTSQHWTLTYHAPPPTMRELVTGAINQGQPAMHYRDQTRDHVTPTMKFPTRTAQHVLNSVTSVTRDSYCLTPVELPPSPAALLAKYGNIADIEDLGQQSRAATHVKVDNIKQASQIEHVTPTNQYAYLMSQDYRPIKHERARDPGGTDLLSQMSIEIHVNTRRELTPNPQHDAVRMIVYCVRDDVIVSALDQGLDSAPYSDHVGVIVCDEHEHVLSNQGSIGRYCHVRVVKTERDMFELFIATVRQYDPDFILGYELQVSSLGYLIERAQVLQIDLVEEIARLPRGHPARAKNSNDTTSAAKWERAHGTGIHVTGRIVLNVWRILRSELPLAKSSYDHVTYHVLHQRVPWYDWSVLTRWWLQSATRWRVIEHVTGLAVRNILLLDALNVIGRCCELARLYGIELQAVLSRGSQYRVEAMILRACKSRDYLLYSPSRQQVALQAAPEALPLVLEPRSGYYPDPVLVLDFQSLYPSIMIAYNYCYSTCLGRVAPGTGPLNLKPFGCHQLALPRGMLEYLEHYLTVSPNRVMYVKRDVQIGILPRLLSELLETRVMVKQSMKQFKHDKSIFRMLDARQLGLKMLANVTYGYTAANFSGRMPLIELADSIVQTARETLEAAIRQVESVKEWGARVIYGDTDSLFVLLKGASRERAFEIGHQIAEQVTRANPYPVKLQFEKLYHPCILAAKKRYVGFKYENKDQVEPLWEAKGIETVRRDSCPAVQKIVQKSLRYDASCSVTRALTPVTVCCSRARQWHRSASSVNGNSARSCRAA